MADRYDVVVIGAGFAGVTAARDLGAAGHSVLLLEARDRIGGRTYTGEAFGRYAEFGGTYVHWSMPNVWREMQRHGIPLATTLEADTVHWLAGGRMHSGSQAEYAETVAPHAARFFADARTRFPRPFDVTAGDTGAIEEQTLADRLDSLGLSAHDRDVLEGILATFVHSPGEQGLAQFLLWASANFGDWGAFLETAGFFPIQGGTKRLIEAVLGESKAELRLSTPVGAVEDDGSGVTVTTRAGERIRARSAVVAVPLNTLGDIAITPAVAPPVRRMIERKHPMRTAKVLARVKGEIDPFLAVAPAGKNPVCTARVEYRHEGDTLVSCFAADASAVGGGDRESVQAALRTFVPSIEVVATAGYDWAGDEFAQGTWVHHRPGDLTGVVPRMREPHGRVHFAGADFAGMYVTGIEGAMETGAGAARNVIAALAGRSR
ncbi:putative flavin-containing monoamine oxidase AofH [Streptomyces mashuensis]|uniref:Flavin-containing monoamine oxidase AofH n=1 Tax=Streptomyces mashuensis TaxID=33904 RepID=A0A919B5K6_9ACTN|nr:NAD(P)/FAD-dependent oxidoreductase [Streptomyces mashuensis]GHF54831.1 putative flavin-containing monoamine oxidase AofH [Streptomyces mashuensis]